ncbi:hypothetical protein [Streptomyces sp. NPDC046887]|uniref:hypothetical protein n=1 Tax=Streptomyces sp. NPDC046887 TaxID=3155472 RepID=UPI0033ED3DE3
MRRWVKAVVAGAVVLGVAGYVAEPYARDWMLVREACDGALDPDAMDRLVPDGRRLLEEKSSPGDDLGSYSCLLTMADESGERDRTAVFMEAYTRRDDRDRELRGEFSEYGHGSRDPLPGGLPGFVDENGRVVLLMRCPDLDRDDAGRPGRLLVRTTLGRELLTGVPGAGLRTAVGLADAASRRLGCGADPLPEPPADALPGDRDDDPDEEPEPVPGTVCDRAVKAAPAGGGWRPSGGGSDTAPAVHCALSRVGDDPADQVRVEVDAYYGDWGNRLLHERGKRKSMTATARCDGEAANFALTAHAPLGVPKPGEEEQRRLLTAFAKDQADRHGCSDPRFTFRGGR